MDKIHIITPVKDSINLTLETASAILASTFSVPFTYTIYNDNSTQENTKILQEESERLGFTLLNLSDMTDHPSPNYLLVLQHAQQRAIIENAALIIVESDVIVKQNTLQGLFDETLKQKNPGIAAAVTVDEQGFANYPYLYAQKQTEDIINEKKHLSFCCSLLTPTFLKKFDFHLLDPNKNWHDVTISHQSLKNGFNNYLFMKYPVWHRPHGSRPWKQLKYKNPLKYYWRKFTKGLDKI